MLLTRRRRPIRTLRAIREFLASRDAFPDKSKILGLLREYQTGKTSQQIYGYVGSLVRRHGSGDVIDDYREIIANNGIRIDDGELVITNTP